VIDPQRGRALASRSPNGLLRADSRVGSRFAVGSETSLFPSVFPDC